MWPSQVLWTVCTHTAADVAVLWKFVVLWTMGVASPVIPECCGEDSLKGTVLILSVFSSPKSNVETGRLGSRRSLKSTATSLDRRELRAEPLLSLNIYRCHLDREPQGIHQERGKRSRLCSWRRTNSCKRVWETWDASHKSVRCTW